jgi:hypothetical protein
MTDLEAILTIEEDNNASEEEIIEAWQQLANSGAWRHFQGFYQRGMWKLVAQGLVTLPGAD